MAKHPPANAGDTGDVGSKKRERHVGLIPGSEDPLEKETATHSSTLVWGMPWTEEPGRPQSIRPQRVRQNFVTKQQRGRNGDSTSSARRRVPAVSEHSVHPENALHSGYHAYFCFRELQ